MSNAAQLSARERIFSLLDENSFVEIGASVTKRSTDFNLGQQEIPADGVITGYGVIDCNPVYVYSQDQSAMNGTIGEMHARKIEHIYDLAQKTGAPVIGLLDCAGLRLQEATDALDAFGKIYLKQSMASGVIPQITAIFGTCGGGLALSASLSDFSFMVEKSSQLFVNSPNTLDHNYTAKCNTASAAFQMEAGTVDFVGKDEESVISQIRELITILPANNEDDASYDECTDDLNRTLDALGTDMKDTMRMLSEISDHGFFMEVKSGYAKEMVTGFIRLNGMTVGAVANREEVWDDDLKPVTKFDGTLTTAGCFKAEKFIEICDAYQIPILTLTNVKGFKATVEEEKSIAIASAKMTHAFTNATVPKVNVIVGKAYGSAYIAMNSKHIGADFVFAYPGTEVGMMDAALAADIICAGDALMDKAETANAYRTLCTSEESAAKRGYIDSIMEPEATRKQLIYAFEMLFTKRESRPARKHGTV